MIQVDPLLSQFVSEFEKLADVSFGKNPGPSSSGVYFKTFDVKYWDDSHQIKLNALMEKYEGKIKAYLSDFDSDDDRFWEANISLGLK